MEVIAHTASPRPRQWLGPLLAGVVLLVLACAVWVQLRPGTSRPDSSLAPEVLRADLEVRDGLLYRKGAAEPFTGTMVERYPDGALLSRSGVVAGRLHGLSEGWYPDGQLQVREHFVRGVSHGERVKWHSNGATQSVATIVEGQLHGRFLRWHENGVLAEEVTLSQGQPDGWAQSYYPDGRPKSRVRLVAGAVVESQFWPETGHSTGQSGVTAGGPGKPGQNP